MSELSKRQKIAIEHPCMNSEDDRHDRYVRDSGKWRSVLCVNWYIDEIAHSVPEWQATAAIFAKPDTPLAIESWTRYDVRTAARILHESLVGVGLEPEARTMQGLYALHAFKELNLKEVRILRTVLAARRTDGS